MVLNRQDKITCRSRHCIRNNLIYNSQKGIWLDWMSQGARVSGNILFDNKNMISLRK